MLQASVLGGAGNDISAYMPYIQGMSYAIVSLLVVAGAFYVAHAYQSGDPDARQKAIRLVGASMFFVTAVTFMPQMLGVESTPASVSGGNGSEVSVVDKIFDRFRSHGDEISMDERIYTFELPEGGSAIIHLPVMDKRIDRRPRRNRI